MAGNWKASLRHFADGWTQQLRNGGLLLWLVVAFVAGTYITGAVFASITVGPAEVSRFVRSFHRAYFDLLGGWMLLWIWLNAFLVETVFAMIGQIRARRVLRQDIIDRSSDAGRAAPAYRRRETRVAASRLHARETAAC